jgi:LuxR family maltose regulon positive regulatory protein
MAGQIARVEERLQSAEAAFAAQSSQGDAETDAETRDLFGQMACARAILALTRYDWKTMIAQARRAQELLLPDNLVYRFDASWVLASAYLYQGKRVAAAEAAQESLALAQTNRHVFSMILATQNMARVQELQNQLHQAAESYGRVLELAGEHPQPNAGEGHLGLARIHYQWNDLEAAQQHGDLALRLLRQFDSRIDRYIRAEVFLAYLKLARGDVAGAAALLAETERTVRHNNFLLRLPEVAEAQVLVLLRQGDQSAAARTAAAHDLPLSRARVHLAGGDPAAALAILAPLGLELEAKNWQDERLQVMVLQAVALQAQGQVDAALQTLGEALALAEPEGYIRIFVDEGEAMRLLIERQPRNRDHPLSDYLDRLLAAFAQPVAAPGSNVIHHKSDMIEPLSQRELEVLKLLRTQLSGPEIASQLTVSLNTFRTHTKNIYSKLGVNSRRAAVDRSEERDIL